MPRANKQHRKKIQNISSKKKATGAVRPPPTKAECDEVRLHFRYRNCDYLFTNIIYNQKCEICTTNPKKMAIIPRGHRKCGKCMENIRRVKAIENPWIEDPPCYCPFCRNKIIRTLALFWSYTVAPPSRQDEQLLSTIFTSWNTAVTKVGNMNSQIKLYLVLEDLSTPSLQTWHLAE